MTRLLYWNVRDFGENKINSALGKRQRGSSVAINTASMARRNVMINLITQIDPDIFVLVETEAPRYANRGQLVQNDGSLTLLGYMQAVRNDWRLVPPIKTGPQECVSVYYRQTNLIFTGPYIWPGGGGGTAQPAGGMAANYPMTYNNGVGNRVVPMGALNNVGANERQLAARVEFTYAANQGINAGNAINYGNQRAPYMVSFVEMDNNMPPNVVRNFSLFGIHAPASANARNYLRDLAKNAQVRDNLNANEVRVIAGDFNWNLLDVNLARRTSYNPLIVDGYTLALNPLNPAPVPPVQGYKLYYGTHLKTTNSAVYWSTTSETVYYPGYGYYSDADFAIDNIYTRYGGGAGGPAANTTICNQVVGSPYNLHPVPVVNTPTGVSAVNIEMNNGAFAAPPNPGPPFVPGITRSFRSWDNYGHIYSTSDHLALSIDL